MKQEIIDRIISNPTDRRKFLRRAGATGIGVAAASMLGGNMILAQENDSTDAASGITDIDILNFALNLEYLEAEFYSVVTTGQTLVELGVLTKSEESGPTTGGHQLPALEKNHLSFLANALRMNEIAHVRFIRKALGSAAVKKPAINLDALGYGFDDLADFLKLSRQFEDVGVSAYLGAAPLIKSKAYLAAAAAIMDTEAQHSGAIRLACINNNVVSPAVDARDVPPTKATPFDVNGNALSIPRTPAEVLNIVYAGGKCSGGFYPDGMNGAIVCQ